ncbi:hypothetical protein LCGC14_3066920, partial [marine sediment metagenome]
MLDPSAVAALLAERAAGRRVGIAVSGGGDSTALLVLLTQELGADGIAVATVDHGLRAGSADEARLVADHCAGLGIPHDTLFWAERPAGGNLQDQARRARYRLLSDWARGRGIAAVTLGHTADDNAETLLMGLTRGAGLDGLSGMRPTFTRQGVSFHRPLLHAQRADLRRVLQAHGVGWSEDPSNDDPRFDRVKMRAAMEVLAPLGITAATLSRSIDNLRDSRTALTRTLADWAARHVRQDRGDLVIAPDAMAALPADMARRLLNAGLRWISGRDYPPRAGSVMQIVASLTEPAGPADRTLHGCRLIPDRGALRLTREAAATGGPVASDAPWDGRWCLSGPHAPE